MNDLVAIFSNLSRSLPPVQNLLGGLSYLLGIVFCMVGLAKFREQHDPGSQAEPSKSWSPYGYLLAGAALLYLPTMFNALSNSLFGAGVSVLQYSGYDPYDIYNAMEILIETIGIIWFLRGCVLLAHSSNPNQGQERLGMKGVLFMISGLFAINFHSMVNVLNNAMEQLFAWSSSG